VKRFLGERLSLEEDLTISMKPPSTLSLSPQNPDLPPLKPPIVEIHDILSLEEVCLSPLVSPPFDLVLYYHKKTPK